MKFIIRFKIGNRYGAGSRYTIREFCVNVVDRYSLTETEICAIVTLQFSEDFTNNDMTIRRIQ
jgi:hypothetical protein